MSNLVEHAKRELKAIGYTDDSPTFIGLVKVIQAFADMGHSGGSASIAIPMIHQLLKFQNLSPITNNPEEWQFHGEDVWGEPGGIWQCTRNGKAFSKDGGKTYTLLHEPTDAEGKSPVHTSEDHTKTKVIV